MSVQAVTLYVRSHCVFIWNEHETGGPSILYQFVEPEPWGGVAPYPSNKPPIYCPCSQPSIMWFNFSLPPQAVQIPSLHSPWERNRTKLKLTDDCRIINWRPLAEIEFQPEMIRSYCRYIERRYLCVAGPVTWSVRRRILSAFIKASEEKKKPK
jgi:hypothetical protein